MKIRTVFVSNSSSSSFIIWTKDLPPEKVKKLCDRLEQIEDKNENEDSEWGDSGKTWNMEKNFIEIETYYLDGIDPDWWKFWEELNIPKENIYNTN